MFATTSFTPSHRGGSGPAMVCLHGFTGTWRTWELVLPMLERRHDVLALTLPGHAGGPPMGQDFTAERFIDEVEEGMDQAGFETAHIVGNSLGGYAALRLAARGRAKSVVALAPAGGWARGDPSFKDTVEMSATWPALFKTLAPHADEIVRSATGRRQATLAITTRFEHIPPELLVHQILGTATCKVPLLMTEIALREGYDLDAERITCPVRVVWGAADKLLAWPSAAARYADEWLPNADWVVLDGVGHCPQLDVPLETAELILGFTAD